MPGKAPAQHVQPIVVNVPQPKIIVNPNVTVQQPPPNPWYEYGVPNLTLVFAFAAAVASVVAVLRMNKQIALALKQIGQQDKVIDLATKDFQVTQQAFALTKREADISEAKRSLLPELRLSIEDGYSPRTVVGNRRLHQEDEEKVAFDLSISIANTGRAVASDVTVELLIPGTWDDNSGSAGFQQPKVFYLERAEEDDDWLGQRRVENNIVPATEAYVGRIYASARPGEYNLRWMAKTAQGFFPQPEPNPDGLADFTIIVEAPQSVRVR